FSACVISTRGWEAEMSGDASFCWHNLCLYETKGTLGILSRARINLIRSPIICEPSLPHGLLKLPNESRAASLILAEAKSCLESGLDGELFNVNRAALERVFAKFSLRQKEVRYGHGVPFVRWSVIVHPIINSGEPF